MKQVVYTLQTLRYLKDFRPERQLEDIRELKMWLLKKNTRKQPRDDENVLKRFSYRTRTVGRRRKNNRTEATNVADVSFMMTGIPVNRIAQTESNKLLNCRNLSKVKLLVKKEAVIKIARSIQEIVRD
jgi:ATP-dependent Clp protease ATP-binding subunit ClpC